MLLVGRGRRSVLARDNRTDSKNGSHCCWVLNSGRIGIDNNGSRSDRKGNSKNEATRQKGPRMSPQVVLRQREERVYCRELGVKG